LSLGSSIGNFTRQEAAKFLGDIAQALQPRDRMIVALDSCKDRDKVFRAYNDDIGLTHEFILNGLAHANRILGEDVFKKGEWTVAGGYDELAGRHRFFYVPVKDVSFGAIEFKAGERVLVEESYKFDDEDRQRLWLQAGVAEGARWVNGLGDYCMCALVFLYIVTHIIPFAFSSYAFVRHFCCSLHTANDLSNVLSCSDCSIHPLIYLTQCRTRYVHAIQAKL
jgi:uncharacterized SAM-dependent methyltransferase